MEILVIFVYIILSCIALHVLGGVASFCTVCILSTFRPQWRTYLREDGMYEVFKACAVCGWFIFFGIIHLYIKYFHERFF